MEEEEVVRVDGGGGGIFSFKADGFIYSLLSQVVTMSHFIPKKVHKIWANQVPTRSPKYSTKVE